jgi:hypothetical protein
MATDSKTKRMKETLAKAILGDRAWDALYPHAPLAIDMTKIDMTKMEALFKTMPKQELDDIAARASKSSAPEAKMVLEAIKGIR